MARYSVDGTCAGAASTTAIAIDGTTTSRGKVYDVLVGSDATPADNAVQWNLKRFGTSNGTGTAVTPVALDPADGVARLQGTETHTTEPTYTANAILLAFSVNQRATFRWVAAPGGELVIPATSDAGIGALVQAIAGSAVAHDVTMHFEE